MQITTIKDEKTEFSAKIVIEPEVINNEVKKGLLSISKKVKLPGFRPGKVPPHMLTLKYGPSIRSEVIEKQINSAINKVIQNNNINLIGDPILEGVNQDEKVGLEFILKCYKLPVIELPNFTQISLEKPVLLIGEEDLTESLEELKTISKVYNNEKKGKAVLTDQVTINATATINGEEFKGGELNNFKVVLGSNSLLPPFEERLIGHKVKDNLELDVAFPPGYSKDLEGKTANFKVEVVAIHKAEVPEINDEFIKTKFNIETLAEFKEQLKKRISNQYDRNIYLMMKMHLFNELNKIVDIDIPSMLIIKEVETLKQQVLPIIHEEESLKDKTPEELEDYFNQLAIRRIKIGLLLSEYVKTHNLQITSNDIKTAIIEQAQNFPGQEQQVVEFYQKDKRAMDSLRGPILEEIAIKHLFNGVVKQVEKSYTKIQLDELLNTEVDPILNI